MIESDPVILSILAVWLAVFGACIGSFLNVVVYRLPSGKSLSDPPSHCPKCGHAIRWFDNVPVFGWLMLGGTCRDCREPISVRYPLVEGLCGLIFGVIAVVLLRRDGDASIQEFFCLALALSTLVVTLLAAGLIELDGRKIPWKLFLPAVLMGPMVPWLWQESFHIRIFYDSIRLQSDTVHWGMPLQSMGYCFMTAMFFYWAIPKEQNVFWPISCVFLGLYFGTSGIFIILSTLILLGALKLFRRKIRSVQLLLALSTFLYFVPDLFVGV